MLTAVIVLSLIVYFGIGLGIMLLLEGHDHINSDSPSECIAVVLFWPIIVLIWLIGGLWSCVLSLKKVIKTLLENT